MAIKGFRDMSSLVNVGVDDSVLQRYALADGVTYDRLVGELRVVLTGLNGEFTRHPLWSSLIATQDAPNVMAYNTGSSTYAEELTDYTRPEPKHAEVQGHMLPLRRPAAALGWTWLKLKDMTFAEGQADIRLAADSLRNSYRRYIFARLLKRGDDLVSSGYSPGFATAAANTNLDFTPPSFGGADFTADHEHYVAAAGGWTTTIIDDMESELKEHGHMGPYRLLIASADAATVTGLTGFAFPTTGTYVPAPSVAVAISEEPATDDGFQFLGSYKNTRIYIAPGMPQHYGFMYRSYGSLSPMNPIRIRAERGYSAPTARVLREATGGVQDAERGVNPLMNLMAYMEVGVGVGNRTNGTTRYVDNANWADGVAI